MQAPQETVPPPPPAFIGSTVASRLSITETERCIVVKESARTQLQLCVLPLIAGLGGAYLLIFESARVELSAPLVMLVSGWGWWFGVRNLARVLGGRRMEIRKSDQSIRLHTLQLLASVSVAREIQRSEITAVRITPTRWHSVTGKAKHRKEIATDSYTLEIETLEEQRVSLCTTDDKSQLESLVRHLNAESIAQETPQLHFVFAGSHAAPDGKQIRTPPLARKGCFACLVLLLLYPLLLGLHMYVIRGCAEKRSAIGYTR